MSPILAFDRMRSPSSVNRIYEVTVVVEVHVLMVVVFLLVVMVVPLVGVVVVVVEEKKRGAKENRGERRTEERGEA
jgi:Na+/H+ antiporter NhaC